MAFTDARQCTATAKSTGERCKAPAVEGRNVCRMHGGNAGRPIIHGRYSLKHRQSLAEKAAKFESVNGDLHGELVVLRALLQDFLDRHEEGVPISDDAIDVVRDLADTIGRMEQRQAKIRKDTAFGAQEMQLFIAAMSSVLQKYVPSDDLPDAINELRSILRSR